MSARSSRTLADLAPTYGAPVALMVLLVLNMLLTPHFTSASNMWNILLQVSTTILVALGMTFVMSTGGIDLSVGSIMAMASVTAIATMHHGALAAIAAGLVVGIAAGALNGVLVARYEIQPFVVTLAMLIAGRGVALVVSTEKELAGFDNAAFEWMGKGRLGPVPAQVAIMVVILLAGWFVARKTAFARRVVAVGGNADAARLSGIDVRRTKLLVYAVSGVLAGLAGLIETARLGSSEPANLGGGMELDAIASAVVGGSAGGKVPVGGAVFGALIIAVISTSINMHLLPFAWSLVVKAAIIVAAVYIQRPKLA